MGAYRDLSGETHGYLIVIRPAGKLKDLHHWICECVCGKFTLKSTGALLKNRPQDFPPNCGCEGMKARIRKQTIHKVSKEKLALYNCYYHMLKRCYDPKAVGFSRYGGRGISVCDRWRFGVDGKTGFTCFVEDLGNKPAKNYSLERKDFNGNYELSNVTWLPLEEQSWNTSRNIFVVVNSERMHLAKAQRLVGIGLTKYNYWRKKNLLPQEIIDKYLEKSLGKKFHLLTYNGETMPLSEWARRLGMDKTTLLHRVTLMGWSTERALTEPVQAHKATRRGVRVTPQSA